MSPSRARRCASAASRTAWPGRLISSDALMNAHPDFVLVWSAFSITSKSARITSSPVSSARRLAFVSRPSRARRLRSLSASATSRSLEPKCWYRVRFVTPARAAIASTPVFVMPDSYVSSLVAPRSASCALGRLVMSGVSIPIGMYTARATHSKEGPSVKALISSDKVPVPAGPYSPGLTVGEWIFLSGQGGFDPNTGTVVSDDLAEQTEQTFTNIETVLAAAGASLDDVVSCLVHLVDLA